MSGSVDQPRHPLPVRRLGPLLLAAGLLALTIGCHSFTLNLLSRGRNDQPDPTAPPLPAPPSRHSLRIAPYVFLSDFELKRDHPVFKELEGLRDQVYRELKLPPGNAVVQVHLFETKERYDQFMRARWPKLPSRRAFFVAQQRGIGGAEDLLVYTHWGERIQQDLRHELTHALLHSVIRVVPLWLDEGLAEYFELPADRAGVNASHLEVLRRELGTAFKPDLARLEKLEDVNDMTRPEYREAWAWAHLMLRSRPEAKAVLLAYLQDLHANRNPGPLAPRLAAVYPSLEEAFTRHLEKIEVPAASTAVPSTPAAAASAVPGRSGLR